MSFPQASVYGSKLFAKLSVDVIHLDGRSKGTARSSPVRGFGKIQKWDIVVDLHRHLLQHVNGGRSIA